MKKWIVTILAVMSALVVQADLLNGGFDTDDGNPNISGSLGASALDTGWHFNNAGNLQLSKTPYMEMGRSEWNTAIYYNAQLWTDVANMTGSGNVSFDVVLDEYTTKSVTGAGVTIEVYGANDALTGANWEFDTDEGAAPSMGSKWSLILSDTVDVSGGLGSYSTVSGTFADYNYLGIRIGIYATGQDGGWGEDIGIDNISVSTVAVPEPATVGMLGLGALVSIFVRRIRR